MTKNTTCQIVLFFFALSLVLIPNQTCAQSNNLAASLIFPEEQPCGPFVSPDDWGPYAVGIERLEFIDESRWQDHGGMFRTLPTTVWYPAIRNTGYPNTLAQCIGTLPRWIMGFFFQNLGNDLLEIMQTETSAYRSADLDNTCAPYPVVFFSHGLASTRIQNYTLCERLAGHGFIVIAPDHYGNAMITNTDQRPVFFDPATIITDVFDRPADVAFIYHSLTAVNNDPAHVLYQAMDMTNFGLTGHSFGGFTCLSAGPRYDFVKSIAPLTPVILGPFPTDFGKPFLLLQCDTDDICDVSLNSNNRARLAFLDCHSSQKVYVMLRNAGHFSPSDICTMGAPQVARLRTGCEEGFISPPIANNITASYLTAFFKATLSHDSRYSDYLTANHFPEHVLYFGMAGF